MGLDIAVKAGVRTIWAPECFTTTDDRQVKAGAHQVSILDWLTHARGMAGYDTPSYTLREIANFMIARIRDQVCVITIDDRSNVTKMKLATQMARVAAIAKANEKKGEDEALPYPKGAFLNDDGGITYTENGMEVTELITLARVSRSRWNGSDDDPRACSNLCSDMWEALHPFLQERVMHKFPGNVTKQIFFDHRKEEFFNFRDDTPDGPTVNVQQLHDLGEADTANFWWLKRFDGQTDAIHLHSTDGDNMPMYAMYHERRTAAQKARTRIWWHCGKGEVVDLVKMVEHMMRKTFLHIDTKVPMRFPTPRTIGLFFVLCDTDFVKRSLFSHGFSPSGPQMINAFLSIDWAGMRKNIGQSPSLFLEEFLIRLYHREQPGAKTTTPQPKEKKLVSIGRMREMHRELEATSRATKTKENIKAMEKFNESWETRTKDMIHANQEAFNELRDREPRDRAAEAAMLSDQREGLQVLQTCRITETRELKEKQQARLDRIWIFPSQPDIDWTARVINWNYSYWMQACEGRRPADIFRARVIVTTA